MALDPTRAAEVKARAILLWQYLVPFVVAHRDEYLGMPSTGPSHRGKTPRDNQDLAPDGQDDYREDGRKMTNLEPDPEKPPILVPHIYPTHKQIYQYIVANERTAGDAQKLLQLYNRSELTGPIPLDHRTTGRENDVGFYVTLDVESSADGKTYRIQQARCWGDDPWRSDTQAAHSDMAWTVVEEAVA